jgi:hypothetical protein
MNFGAKLGALTVTVLVMSALGAALAQPAAPPGAAAASEEEQLPPALMLARSKEYLPQMEELAAGILEQVKKARKEKDVVKSLCLNDKHGQMDLALRTAVDRVQELEKAVAQNDVERARHQYTVLRVLRERATTLVAEAQQCIGEDTGFVGDSDVTFEIDPSIPEVDPSAFPEEPLLSAAPVLTSPTF